MTHEQINWMISCTQNDIQAGTKLLAEKGATMPSKVRLRLVVAKAELEWALEKLYEALAGRSL